MISVIVAIYNIEDYLMKCIDSIRNQTYQNLEIILVDDGSVDNSGNICDDYKGKDKRIKVIHKKNGGLSSARNEGLNIAKGKYIIFIDGDDYVDHNMIEKLFEGSIQYDADIVCCDFICVSENGTLLESKDIVCSKVQIFNHDEAMNNLDEIGVVSWAKLYRNYIFERVRYPIGRLHEDEYVIHEVLYVAKKIIKIKSKLYYYTQRESSITHTIQERNLLDAIQAYEERILFINGNHWLSVKARAMEISARYVLDIYYNPNVIARYDKARKMLRKRLKKIIQQNKDIKLPVAYRIFARSPFFYRGFEMMRKFKWCMVR